MQEPQPLGHHLRVEKIDAGRVAARPSETGDKTPLDRVTADAEDDWNRRCCSFGRERGCVSGRRDHGHTAADQISHQCRQIVLALQPVVLDRHVLAIDVAVFVEVFAERGHKARVAIGRPLSNKPDHRHRRLLRPYREGPSERGAAEPGYELSSSDVECHLPCPQWGSCPLQRGAA